LLTTFVRSEIITIQSERESYLPAEIIAASAAVEIFFKNVFNPINLHAITKNQEINNIQIINI